MKHKIIQICSGTDGNLYALTEEGEVLQYMDHTEPGDYGQGRIYDGWTRGWHQMSLELSQPIPHKLKAK